MINLPIAAEQSSLAIALIILAFTFFILELHIISFGLLSLAGLLSLFFGTLLLLQTEDLFIHLHRAEILAAVAAGAIFLVLLATYWYRDARHPHHRPFNKEDPHGLLGQVGMVLAVGKGDHNVAITPPIHFVQVKIAGEIWNAWGKAPMNEGQFVRVLEIDEQKLLLEVGIDTTTSTGEKHV